MSNKLLPCPFCGNGVEIQEKRCGFYAILCEHKGCQTEMLSSDRDDLINKWNTRSPIGDKNE